MFTDIIWDFDGTLFDTYPAMVSAFKMALRDQNFTANEEEILRLMKGSLGHAIEHYKENYNIDAISLADRFAYYENKFDLALFKPFPDIKRICEGAVNRNYRNYIFTHKENLAVRILKYYEMDDLFVEVVTREYGFKRKPDPEGFLYLINKYQLEKSTTIAIGDRELDILAAHNAGIKSCLFDKDFISPSCKTDFRIESISELATILQI